MSLISGGIEYRRQKAINLKYKGKEAGLHRIYKAQLLTYLRAMEKRVGLLINFNVLRLKQGIKRLIL